MAGSAKKRDARRRIHAEPVVYPPMRRVISVFGMVEDGVSTPEFASLDGQPHINPLRRLLFALGSGQSLRVNDLAADPLSARYTHEKAAVGLLFNHHVDYRLESP